MKGAAETQATYFVDAGDAFFKNAYVIESKRDHLTEVAKAILQSYNTMDCKVMNMGTHDLGAGIDFILDLEKEANFPFISANIVKAGTDELLFQKYAIVKSLDRTLGFVGVTLGDKRLKEFDFKDPVEAAKLSVEEIRDKVDMVFLMANVNDKIEKQLTEEIDGVDFLLRSQTGSVLRNPREQDGEVIIRIGKQGKYAGLLRIQSMDKTSELKNVSSQYTRIKFTDNRLAAMRKGLDENITLEDHYAGDEKRLLLIERLRKERQTNIDLIKSLKNTYYLEAIPLNDKIADTPEVAKIVKEYMPVVKEKSQKEKKQGKAEKKEERVSTKKH